MKKIATLFFLVCLSFSFSYGQIKLPRLIGDGMVLQRDSKIKLWGWASPNEKVKLQFNQEEYNTTADKNGSWSIILPPQPAGGPYNMTFSGNNTVGISNILFGDVWICSGQSNMELTMERVKDKYAAIIAGPGNDK
ncbi:MAG TPA: sialate O-acetylesterase, partial [Chitinophaga sp.]